MRLPLRAPVRLVRVGLLTHVKHMSRSPLEIVIAVFMPLVYACLAVYLFRAGSRPNALLEAAIGAGLMGTWTSVLFGAGAAIQSQRQMGVLQALVGAPRPLVLVVLPITLASAVVGAYAVVGTLLWGRLVFGIPLAPVQPVPFLVAILGTVLALGGIGLLIAALFVLVPNANAFTNALDSPVWLLSGLLVPVAGLPSWSSPVTAALPMTWGARALRSGASGGPVWTELATCLGLGLLYLLLGVAALTRVETAARRSATLALA
jgi:ABC-2 type transport system permease protein